MRPKLSIDRPAISNPRPIEASGAWTAILLAGDRPGGDPLARHFGVCRKALVAVAGRTMLGRVAATLLAAPEIGRVVVLAQDPQALLVGDAAWLAGHPQVAIASSGRGIASSISAIAGSAAAPFPLLVTTADHVLLTEAMLAEFLASAAADCDAAFGVGERRNMEAAYPGNRRTWLRFPDGDYSGANLFALRNVKVATALNLWEGYEQDRKQAWKLFARFGPELFLRALTRTISFPAAVRRAGLRLSVRVKPIVMSAAEAMIDVDKLADHALAEAILRKRACQGA
jgi:GTP:adenosylcobinamide-phosphate guanylyltransferase